jgi:hypothetical protein
LRTLEATGIIDSMRLILLDGVLIFLGAIALVWVALTNDNSHLLAAAAAVALTFVAIVSVTRRGSLFKLGGRALVGLVAIGGVAWLVGAFIAQSL